MVKWIEKKHLRNTAGQKQCKRKEPNMYSKLLRYGIETSETFQWPSTIMGECPDPDSVYAPCFTMPYMRVIISLGSRQRAGL
jgi:hypothetical protein